MAFCQHHPSSHPFWISAAYFKTSLGFHFQYDTQSLHHHDHRTHSYDFKFNATFWNEFSGTHWYYYWAANDLYFPKIILSQLQLSAENKNKLTANLKCQRNLKNWQSPSLPPNISESVQFHSTKAPYRIANAARPRSLSCTFSRSSPSGKHIPQRTVIKNQPAEYCLQCQAQSRETALPSQPTQK